MRMKLNREGLEMMRAVAAHPVNKGFIDLLKGNLEETRKANDTLEGIPLYRSQGEAILLSEILTIFENAHELAEAPDKAEGISSEDSGEFI